MGERMYIDVDVPGGPEEDGAPHWGVRGHGASAGEPVPALVPCAPAMPRSRCSGDHRRTCQPSCRR